VETKWRLLVKMRMGCGPFILGGKEMIGNISLAVIERISDFSFPSKFKIK
jgi:hypothetical protein